MSTTYRVVAGCCPGHKRNYQYNELVTANDVDDVARRVKEGWLKEVIEEEATEEPVKEETKAEEPQAPIVPEPEEETKPKTEPTVPVVSEPEEETKPEVSLEEMTKQQLMDTLTKKGIAFNGSSSKPQLIELLKKA